MTTDTRPTLTGRMAFWQAINDALEARNVKHATYGEIRDFWESGYRMADVPKIAAQWSANSSEEAA